MFTRRCSDGIERELRAPPGTATCRAPTTQMCATALDPAPGDEAIVPSFAFVSTVNAFVLRGIRPVFADVRAEPTLNLDDARLPDLITPRTRAIVALHYAGVARQWTAIAAVAGTRGIAVVEDNAHGLFGSIAGARSAPSANWRRSASTRPRT